MARKTNRVLQATQEDIKMIHEDNKRLLSDFLLYYQATDHAIKSCIVTESNLNIFFVWNMKYNKNKVFPLIKRRDYLAYQSYLLSLDLSPARIRALKSSISSLSIYCEEMVLEELSKYDPDYELWQGWTNCINKIKSPAIAPTREKSVFEDEDIQKLLDTLVEKKKYQQACALALAWASGSRKAEIVQFKVEDLTDETLQFGGSMWLTKNKIRCKGQGRMGKQLHRYVLVSKFKKYLDLWLERRAELGIDSEWLFVVKSGDNWEQAKDTTLNSYVRTFTAMLNKSFYFHSMRHQFVTELIAQNVPNAVVVEIVQWSSDLCHIYNDKGGSAMIGKYFNSNGIVKQEEKSLSDL